MFFAEILSQVWAIEPNAGQNYLTSARAIFDNRIKSDFKKPEPQAVSFISTKTNVEGEAIGNVAVIPVMGPLVHRAGGMAELCGIVSYQKLQDQIESVEQNDDVETIVFRMDSPGGSVYGLESTFAKIRGIEAKTIAYVERGMAASACYYLASACDEIVMSDKTAQVGSIGTMVEHRDYSEANAKDGVKITYLTNTKGTKKITAPDNKPLSEGDTAELTQMLDAFSEFFFSAVQSGRPNANLEMMDGRLMFAEEAIENGFADSIETFDSLINKLKMSEETEGLNLLTKALNKLGFVKAEAKGESPEEGETPDIGAEIRAMYESKLSAQADQIAAIQAQLDAVMQENESVKAELNHIKGQGPEGDADAKEMQNKKLYQKKVDQNDFKNDPLFRQMHADALTKNQFN